MRLMADVRVRTASVALLCTAQFVVVLDVTIVAVALPAIGRGLGFAVADLQWVVTAYTLVFAGFLVLAGRVADLVGRRRVFLAGLALFSLASLACGLSRTPGALVAARAVQASGRRRSRRPRWRRSPPRSRTGRSAGGRWAGGRPRPPAAVRPAGCSAAC